MNDFDKILEDCRNSTKSFLQTFFKDFDSTQIERVDLIEAVAKNQLGKSVLKSDGLNKDGGLKTWKRRCGDTTKKG